MPRVNSIIAMTDLAGEVERLSIYQEKSWMNRRQNKHNARKGNFSMLFIISVYLTIVCTSVTYSTMGISNKH